MSSVGFCDEFDHCKYFIILFNFNSSLYNIEKIQSLSHGAIWYDVAHGISVTYIENGVLAHRGHASLNKAIIGSDNGLRPVWCQAIIRASAGILLIGPREHNPLKV